MTRPTFTLPLAVQPDLAATMDIQIPALAWQAAPEGRWVRSFYLDGREIPVEMREDKGSLRFFYDAPAAAAAELQATLSAAFATPVEQLSLAQHPILAEMQRRYRGVIVMTARPFEALVLTILSQNRTGEIVRAVYPHLAAACNGVTPDTVASLALDDLTAVIRSAGPYKAPRLGETARTVAAIGEGAFDAIVRGPHPQALAYLESLPGVAHKTAACVLVFSASCTTTIPVDTHLFRVADRLGLVRHAGRNTKTTREQLISALLRYGPDVVPAHFLFLLVGRTTCVAGQPHCSQCFLVNQCPYPEGGGTP